MPQRADSPQAAPTGVKGLATRERILARAIERFADQGYRQTSVARVAREAGLTPPAVHAHFGSKEALFDAAFEQDVEALLSGIKDRIASGELRPDGRGGMLLALLAELDAHPLARRILQGHETEHAARLLELPPMLDIREQLTGIITVAQRAGVVRDDLTAVDLAGAVETLALALLAGAVQFGMIGDRNRPATIVAILVRGLRRPEGDDPV